MLSAMKKDEGESVAEPIGESMDGQPKTLEITATPGMSDDNANPSDPPDQFIAFARVYSGVIKKGQKLFVLGPKHEPCAAEDVVKDETEDSSEEVDTQ